MCGIFGYVGKKSPLHTVLNGLKKLEYRGYDSAGMAGVKDHALYFWKEVGKVSELEKEVLENPVDLEIAIAQTRWATHGAVTKINAHPHLDEKNKIALVHNGIIENYAEIKKELLKEGIQFRSETDTEVIVQLIAKHYDGDLLKAVQQTLPQLKGAYAFVLIHADHPDTIIAVAQECPLVIGIGKDEAFVSSDYHAFAFHTRQVVYLSDSEIAVVKANQLEIFNAQADKIHKEALTLEEGAQEISKGAFEHYTLKEIFEQPTSLRSALVGRFIQDYGTASFEDVHIPQDLFSKVERILVLGCGSSYHAGYIASYMIEEMAGIPTSVEISSEFRYKNPVIQPNTLVIALSQSGETADTIAAVRELKAKGATILALSNVYASTIARESDGCLYLRAGPEVGVCSTKAYTSQLAILALISLLLSRMRRMTKQEGIDFLNALEKIPDQAKEVLASSKSIEAIADFYAQYHDFFFLGRNYMYPAALEGALKLKEISYVNANGYPAGELKHGPIALINAECPTVAMTANKATYPKLVSNMMEIKLRNGPIIAIAEKGSQGLEAIANHIIWVPKTIDPLAPILTAIAAQLFAYWVAKKRGSDIDQPRNLAKSVTVE
jgi:glucosamine--fructose-6-phosphate aminotransferase (isomerizing)